MKDSRPPLDPPPWATVLATTLRLWVQRHVLPGRGGEATGRRSPVARRGYVRAGIVTVVIAVFAAGAASVAIAVTSSPGARRGGAPAAAGSSAQPPGSAALAAASVSRMQAAAWIAAQVSHAVIVACDPLTCTALQQHGFPAADLEQISAGSGDPLGSGIVVSTLAVRSQLGTRLAQVYAPTVIASFGAGSSLVEVRVTAAGGAAAYLSAEQADLRARTVAGRELAGSKAIREPAAAAAELSDGHVDARLLITLAALAHSSPVQITGFSDSGPGAGTGGPLRAVTITAATPAYLRQLLAFLRAQRAPLLASVSAHQHGQTADVQVEFTAPSPPGLLGSTPSQ